MIRGLWLITADIDFEKTHPGFACSHYKKLILSLSRGWAKIALIRRRGKLR
jgi:hypothetical protein